MVAWFLEILIGTWLLLLACKRLPELLNRLDREPLATTRLPASDVPDVLQGGIAGGSLFGLVLIVISTTNGPLSAAAAFAMFCSFPILGALLQQRLTGRQLLAPGQLWRTQAEQLAQKAGIGPIQIVLVQTINPQILVQRQTILLPTCAARRFSSEELQFLMALALWELRGGQRQSDLADQFALSLTQDLEAAQKALRSLHLHQDIGHYLPHEVTEQRIERLTSWWQRQQSPKVSVPTTAGSSVRLQRQGRP